MQLNGGQGHKADHKGKVSREEEFPGPVMIQLFQNRQTESANGGCNCNSDKGNQVIHIEGLAIAIHQKIA